MLPHKSWLLVPSEEYLAPNKLRSQDPRVEDWSVFCCKDMSFSRKHVWHLLWKTEICSSSAAHLKHELTFRSSLKSNMKSRNYNTMTRAAVHHFSSVYVGLTIKGLCRGLEIFPHVWAMAILGACFKSLICFKYLSCHIKQREYWNACFRFYSRANSQISKGQCSI